MVPGGRLPQGGGRLLLTAAWAVCGCCSRGDGCYLGRGGPAPAAEVLLPVERRPIPARGRQLQLCGRVIPVRGQLIPVPLRVLQPRVRLLPVEGRLISAGGGCGRGGGLLPWGSASYRRGRGLLRQLLLL